MFQSQNFILAEDGVYFPGSGHMTAGSATGTMKYDETVTGPGKTASACLQQHHASGSSAASTTQSRHDMKWGPGPLAGAPADFWLCLFRVCGLGLDLV